MKKKTKQLNDKKLIEYFIMFMIIILFISLISFTYNKKQENIEKLKIERVS